tara:strand:- start:496 stop:1182 length:687 start_codon:yes stop_codon:yes gene_type:complete
VGNSKLPAGISQQFFCLLVYTLNSLIFFFGVFISFSKPFMGLVVLSVTVPVLWVVYRREMEKPEGIAPLLASVFNSIFFALTCLIFLAGRAEMSSTFVFLFLMLNLIYMMKRYQSHTDCGDSVLPFTALLLLSAYFWGAYGHTRNPLPLAAFLLMGAGGLTLWMTRGVTTKSGKTLRNYALTIIGISLIGAWLLAGTFRDARLERIAALQAQAVLQKSDRIPEKEAAP